MTDQLKSIPVDCIVRGKYQPRKYFDEALLKELSDSIVQTGLIEPVVVRPLSTQNGNKELQYELLAGERRWRATALAQIGTIPAIIREKVTDEEAGIISLVENLQREDLRPIEEAESIKRLIFDNALTHEEAADILSCSRSSITNSLRLLELAPAMQEWVEGSIAKGRVKALLAAPRGYTHQTGWANYKKGHGQPDILKRKLKISREKRALPGSSAKTLTH